MNDSIKNNYNVRIAVRTGPAGKGHRTSRMERFTTYRAALQYMTEFNNSSERLNDALFACVPLTTHIYDPLSLQEDYFF